MKFDSRLFRLSHARFGQRSVQLLTSLLFAVAFSAPGQTAAKDTRSSAFPVMYNTVKIDGLEIFYREAGDKQSPSLLLLHGFPTSSHMFRNLIPSLAAKYHVVAPDYPGFGQSSMPKLSEFDYTFDRLSDVVDKLTQQLGVKTYSPYVQDYGAPVGFRLAAKHPERVQALIVQNGNAYEEGLRDFWDPFKAYWQDRSEATVAKLRPLLELGATKWQYTHGTRKPDNQNPENWTHDQALLDRAGNKEIQLQLFYDYGSNRKLYPDWQAYFRKHQPPTLIVWGKNDLIFPAEGAAPYKRDLKNVETHLLDTGHFALEEEGGQIAQLILDFLGRNLSLTHHNTAAEHRQ